MFQFLLILRPCCSGEYLASGLRHMPTPRGSNLTDCWNDTLPCSQSKSEIGSDVVFLVELCLRALDRRRVEEDSAREMADRSMIADWSCGENV